ncbi:MAG TPA: cysteine--tRNA ligase [Gemmatimonadales bacterium]|nr:cysteine--tRNA ligase [Gemmatimonadales bacterium]
MSLRLHNTLTRTVEPFVPLAPPRVTLYTCGPTVYNYAHIGNFRTFLFEDLLRRWLETSGYRVFHVMNLTDVDDKTIKRAAAAGVPIGAYVQPFIDAFFADRDYLRIRPADAYPRATAYIGPMIALTEALLAKGIAYQGEDGSVYFAIGRFPAYGRLSRLDQRELRTGAAAAARTQGGHATGARGVSADEYAKEDARDFALWKAARPEDEAVGAAWDAPFGRGRPGWHLECSAMALDLIATHAGTDVLDIHAGGVDLIFPHHEDEIAQSCAYTGKPEFARYWLHGEFLNVHGTKMSKRYGNILTARDLKEQGVDAGAVRRLIFGTHYRQTLDWTDEALAAAQESSTRLGTFRDRLAAAERTESGRGGPERAEDPESIAAAQRFRADFTVAMDDDLNAPQAIAALFELVREGNRLLDAGRRVGPAMRGAWALSEAVLDLAPASRTLSVGPSAAIGDGRAHETPPETPPAGPAEQEEWARRWAEVRQREKGRRNFAEADRVRALLRQHGFELRDMKDGTVGIVRTAPVDSA